MKYKPCSSGRFVLGSPYLKRVIGGQVFSKGAISPIFFVEMFAISGGQTSLGSLKLHNFFDSETRVTPHLVVYHQLIISTSLSKMRFFWGGYTLNFSRTHRRESRPSVWTTAVTRWVVLRELLAVCLGSSWKMGYPLVIKHGNGKTEMLMGRSMNIIYTWRILLFLRLITGGYFFFCILEMEWGISTNGHNYGDMIGT